MQSWRSQPQNGSGQHQGNTNNKRTAAGANFPSPKDPRIEDDMSDDDADDGDGDSDMGKDDDQQSLLSQAVLRPLFCGPWAR